MTDSRFSTSLEPHRRFLVKIDSFEQRVRRDRADDMQCRSGCTACCQTRLSVCDVEADLIRSELESLSTERLRELIEQDDESGGRCVMLDQEGRCAIYDARPVVCRTQGLPLRYPDGVLAEETVFASTAKGPITWCPLNFQHSPPRGEDVLDAERVDVMLALSNREYTRAAQNGSVHERSDLDALVAEALGKRESG